MYGMINEAIRCMVIERRGAEAWEAMAARADSETAFLLMGQYPDAMTYALVAAAADEFGADTSEVLESFGSYWIEFASQHYGELFDLWGDSFPDTVANLNALHSRIGQLMPSLRPPSFSVSERSERHFLLHYYSEREGLQPMVIGLLKGVAKHFNVQADVKWLRDQTEDHAVFSVSWR